VSASDELEYDPLVGPRDRLLRAGDRERDAVGEILRRRHLEGRLDADEFEDRLGRCLAAKTYAELDELIADFPHEGVVRRGARQPSAWRPWPLAFPVLAFTVIVAIAVGGHVAWLAVPLFFLFVVRPLAWRSWGRGYARRSWACGPWPSTRA
jgi:hypothetical protein